MQKYRLKTSSSRIRLIIVLLLAGAGLTLYFIFGGLFRFTFLVIYLLPHIYLYGHLKRVFTGGRSRVIFTGVFLLIILLFPVSMLLDEDAGSSFVKYMQLGGYYYLPVLLYGLLFYGLFDLFRIINYLTGIFPRPAINRRRVRSVVFTGILILTAIIVAVGIHRFNHTRVHTYQIKVPQRSGKLDHLTIAMAADLHLSQITRTGFVEQFVEKINAQDPDLVLLVGDIVESGGDVSGKQSFSNHLKQLQSKYGVFAVEGNHEHYGRRTGFNFFEESGIQLLRDTSVVVDKGVALVGRRDRHERDRASLEQLLKQAPDSLPRIVMDHQPYHLHQAARQDMHVQFSGHTHHGQLWPLNHITEAIYEISWGHEKIRDTHFFVTCGAQGWGPPVKTSSRSEVMLVEVEFVAD
ncbi:MAG: metallophosphoesterase [Bacteroidales bacterium]|nr:metallophosphoesterase [Bacteroidales bacterium]